MNNKPKKSKKSGKSSKTTKSNKSSKTTKSSKMKNDVSPNQHTINDNTVIDNTINDNTVIDNTVIDNTSSSNTTVDNTSSNKIILNDDTMDGLEGMVDKLEETNNMAEKVRLHSEISNMTKSIKFLIDTLIKDVDDQKIMADPETIFADDLDPNAKFDVLGEINNLETELENMEEIDNLRQKVDIYIQLQKKCQVLKKAADEGELVIRKCN
jgi:hypothetical protein